MQTLRDHWITALALLAATFLILTGIGMVVTGGGDNEAGVRVFGAVSLLAAASLVGGLYGLRTNTVRPQLAHTLIVVGLVILGGGFWWFIFLPPAIALVVIYAGVMKKGLDRELGAGV